MGRNHIVVNIQNLSYRYCISIYTRENKHHVANVLAKNRDCKFS